MITIGVSNTTSKIISTLPIDIVKSLDELLSFTVSGAYFILKTNPYGGWDGRTRLFSRISQTFPTGLLPKVIEFLQGSGLQVDVKNHRVTPLGAPLPFNNILYDWQNEAVDTCIKNIRGINKSSTGSGKTMIMMTTIGTLGVPTIILINKKDLLWQTKEKIEEYLHYTPGIIGDGSVKVDPLINVCMIQTLYSLCQIKPSRGEEEEDSTRIDNAREVTDMIHNCKFLAVDEVHHMVSRTMYNFQKKCVNAYYRFGYSATPFSTMNKDLLLEASIGPVVVRIGMDFLIEKGFIAKPKFYWIKYSHHGKPYNALTNYPEVYHKGVIENEERNQLIVSLAAKAYKDGKRILITVTNIEHGRILEEMFKVIISDQKEFFINGRTPSELRNHFRKALSDGDIRLAIVTVIFNEAIDIPNLDVIINTKAQKSTIDFLQLVGRGLRITKTKKTCTVIDIADISCKYLSVHSKHRFECLEEEKLIEHNFIKIKK